jgi:glutaredoxin 3
MAKRYFAERGLDYVDMDVSKDRAALKEMVTATGQYGVPVIRVGEKAMVGWDKKEFERLAEG